MDIIYDSVTSAVNSAVALGMFDGLHRGHIALINEVTDFAQKNNIRSCVFTFEPNPALKITDNEARNEILENIGVDILSVQTFDGKFKSLSPEEFFLKYLKNSAFIAVGYNFCFGKDRTGNTATLKRLCGEYNIPLKIIPEVKINGETISSTNIRAAVKNGDFQKAKLLLGRDFYIEGTVIKGDMLGKSFGFPTANINIPKGFVMPSDGVYATETVLNDVTYESVTNIGGKPTVRDGVNRVECHILNFNKDIYGEKIKIRFIKKLREIVKFNSIDELKTQLKNDVITRGKL